MEAPNHDYHTAHRQLAEAKAWLNPRWPPNDPRPRALIGAIEREFKVGFERARKISAVVYIHPEANRQQRRVMLDRLNITALVAAARLVNTEGWSDERIAAIASILREEETQTPALPPSSALEPSTALLAAMYHRTIRWIAGLLARSHGQSRIVLFFRSAEPGPVRGAGWETLSASDVTAWRSSTRAAIRCVLAESAAPYLVQVIPDLSAESAEDPAAFDHACLHVLRGEAGMQWEVLLLTKGGPGFRPQPLDDQVPLLLWGLLRMVAQLVPALSTGASEAFGSASPTSPGEDRLDRLGIQLQGLPDAIMKVSESWSGCVISLPDPQPAAARNLHVVCHDTAYPPGLPDTVQVDHPGSPSARAFSQLRTIVLEMPTRELDLHFEAAQPTFCMAIPLGVTPRHTAEGSLYLFTRGESAAQELAKDSGTTLEVIAGILGDAIRGYVSQEDQFEENYQLIRDQLIQDGGSLDRMTGWRDVEQFYDQLAEAGTQLAVIVIRLTCSPDLGSDVAIGVLQLLHKIVRDDFPVELAHSLDDDRARTGYTVYTLDREHYAVVMTGDQHDPAYAERFYLAKNILARLARRLNFGGSPGSGTVVWVRAATVSRAEPAGVPVEKRVDDFLKQQLGDFGAVQELENAILSGHYQEAADFLDILRRRSTSARLGWSVEDPAIVLDAARIDSLSAIRDSNLAQLEQVIASIDRVPPALLTGALRREYCFALTKHVEFAYLTELIGTSGRSRSRSAKLKLKREATASIDAAQGAADLVVSGGDTTAAHSTRREVRRMLEDLGRLRSLIGVL